MKATPTTTPQLPTSASPVATGRKDVLAGIPVSAEAREAAESALSPELFDKTFSDERIVRLIYALTKPYCKKTKGASDAS